MAEKQWMMTKMENQIQQTDKKNNNNTPTPQNLLKRAVATRKTTISVIYCAISTDGVNLAAGL